MTLKPAYDLRPLAIGEMLDYTFRIYQRVFPFVAVPTALLQGPAMFPIYFFSESMQQFSRLTQTNPDLFNDINDWASTTSVILEQTGIDLTWSANWGIPELGLLAVGVLLYSLFMMAAGIITHLIIVGVVGQRILGIEPSWEEVGRIITRFGWRGVALTFLQLGIMLLPFVPTIILALITAVGGPDFFSYIGIALLFPAYFVMLWMIFIIYLTEPALVVEDLGPVAAMRRAFQLIRGNWWRLFGVLLVMGLIVQFFQSLTAGGSTLLLAAIFPKYQVLISSTLNTVALVFLTPLSYIIIVLMYFDIRVRNEQFDLYFLLGQQTGLGTEGVDPSLMSPPQDQPYVSAIFPTQPPTAPPSLPGQ